MSNLLWTHKKSLMNSRIMESKHGLNGIGDFDQMVEKQLNDDFKVSEYLSENKTEECSNHRYMGLLNTMLIEKQKKKKVKDSLINKMGAIGLHKDSVSEHQKKWGNENEDTYYSEEEYLKIKEESQTQQQLVELKTREELEMRKILWKQINDKKKSLDLLKGDIGHMITRNESISVLESKVGKVKLVSENQYKRVSLALSKDKEEVQLRQQMQKKFQNKLKSFGSSQNRNLNKAKSSYIEMMNRRKQIYEKLSLLQSQAASIELYSDKEKQYKEKNIKTLTSLSLISYLCRIIERLPIIQGLLIEKKINHHKYCELMREQFNSIIITAQSTKRTLRNQSWEAKSLFYNIDEVQSQKLEAFIKLILEEHQRIQLEIEQKKKVYNQLIKSLEELSSRHHQLELEQVRVIHSFVKEEKDNIKGQQTTVGNYSESLGCFEVNLRAVGMVIEFLNRQVNFQGFSYISKLYEIYMWHYQVIKQWPQFPQNNTHQIDGMADELEQLEQIQNPSLFESLQNNLITCFQQIKRSILNKKNYLGVNEFHFVSSQNVDQKIQNIIAKTISDWKQINEMGSFYEKCNQGQANEIQSPLEENQSEKEFQLILESNPDHNNTFTIKEADCSMNSFHNKSIGSINDKCGSRVAKRVQLLENIDQRYYKMIKDTLEMEKENTRKNYEFRKNFKRTKYSTQDQLLQEKRFQSTFSGLFKQDSSSQSTMRHHKTLQDHSTSENNRHTKIKLSGTFHTRSFHLLKKCKEGYLQKIKKSKNSFNADNRYQSLKKQRAKQLEQSANRKYRNGQKQRMMSSHSRKNLHSKLKQIIDIV